jgi:hypothetical protein
MISEYVAPNYFEFLGVNAQLGRLLPETDRKLPHLVISLEYPIPVGSLPQFANAVGGCLPQRRPP